MVNMREFLNGVIDYIELSQETVDGLRKRAAAAESKPAFSDGALKQTADKLVKANLLSKEAADHLVQSFRGNPDKALHSLQRVADEMHRRSEERATSLGSAAPLKKKAGQKPSGEKKSASDEAWENSWG